MVTRIRRAVVAVAPTLLLMATALAGVGGQHDILPGVTSTDGDGYCEGTDRNDVMYGTKGKDEMYAWRGADTMYGRGGRDALYGKEGPDVAQGGPGNDYLGSECDVDAYCGEDEKHGGLGDDHIVGNLRSEKHFGGRGNDSIVDADSGRYPDVIRCGPGRDEVLYNKGFDKVAEDCEILKPYPKRWWTP